MEFQLGFWDFFIFIASAVVTCVSAVWALSRVVLRGMDSRFDMQDAKFRTLGEDMRRLESSGHENEKALLRLRADLPNQYVRREDWIRFSGLIDTKMDRLSEKIDIIVGMGTKHAE